MDTYPPMDGTQPCRYDPQAFFPRPGESALRAKRICRACPFRRACLRYALVHDLHGIWGGATRNERITYQRERGIAPIPTTVPAALGERQPPKRPAPGQTNTDTQNGPNA